MGEGIVIPEEVTENVLSENQSWVIKHPLAYRLARPEWWTPSEHTNHSKTFAIRLADITSIEARDITKDDGSTSYAIDMYYDLCSRHLHYDTPEHRGEDFLRLKLALGVE
jgi:hypothetical protein